MRGPGTGGRCFLVISALLSLPLLGGLPLTQQRKLCAQRPLPTTFALNDQRKWGRDSDKSLSPVEPK